MQRILLIVLAAMAAGLMAPVEARAQMYFWNTEDGIERSTTKLDDVPTWARKKMRCVAELSLVLAGDRIEIEGGQAVRLIGVDAPDFDGAILADQPDRSREKLTELLPDGPVTLRYDEDAKDETGDMLAYVYDKNGRFVNEAMLASGMAFCSIKLPNIACEEKLRAAAAKARDEGLGLWGSPKPVAPAKRDAQAMRRGFSLGLYARNEKFDYTQYLQEMKDVGSTHMMLITPWFLEDWESVKVYRRTFRSAPLSVVYTVARKARELGMEVMLMPIVLLTNADDKHWRGNIAPKDLFDFFSSYNEFIGAFADCARAAGCESLVVGSELSSIEKYTDQWKMVVKNVRARYGGLLTYSANWDHFEIIRFWDDLDMIGMTGYHSLTTKNDPTVPEIQAEWDRIRDRLVEQLEPKKKPYFFTEMGYASLDGINKDPWDYVHPKTIDTQEQADCYEAWFRSWKTVKGNFHGAYFYTWWRNGDEDDARGYTIYGKPAEAVVKKWFNTK